MLKGAQDEAQQTARESISQVISSRVADEETEQSSSSRGFLGSFADEVKKLEVGDREEKMKAAKEEKEIAMQAKITNELAPKIAVQALGEALMVGQKKLGVSSDSIEEMKQKMAEKIKKPATEELKKFDSLPVAKPKIEEPKDAVSEFLEKARTQEIKEREEEAKKNQDGTPTAALVQAAHKEVEADQSLESNPLTEMYLKKHPQLLDQAKETDWSSIARGDQDYHIE